jgi:hypothetical protein
VEVLHHERGRKRDGAGPGHRLVGGGRQAGRRTPVRNHTSNGTTFFIRLPVKGDLLSAQDGFVIVDLGERLLTRADEPSLTIATVTRPWSFSDRHFS